MSVEQSGKPYQFTLNPKLSYICTDLLAQIKTTPEASCVARVLTGKKVMSIVEQGSYYFTPYFTNDINKPDFNKLYSQTKKMLPTIPWISSMSIDQFNNYDNKWEQVKLKLNAKTAQ